MSDWDDNSPQFAVNLARIVAYVSEDARTRPEPSLEYTLKWHKDLMYGLDIPPEDCPSGIVAADMIGRFRGIAPLGTLEVGVRDYARIHMGVRSDLVPAQLKAFEQELQRKVNALDAEIDADLQDPTPNQILEVLRLCAWAHAEWIRIHPFANGNGRTARIWVNYLALRYALPPFLRLRPRPGPDYEAAGAAAMEGYWERTFVVFMRMYQEYNE
jgi:Fic family protein